MKDYLPILILALLSLSLHAQRSMKYCGFETQHTSAADIQKILSKSSGDMNLGRTSIPIAITFLMKSDSTSSYYEGLENEIMDSLAAHFLPRGIHLYLAESPYFIYEDEAYDFDVRVDVDLVVSGLRQNRVNILIANSVRMGSGSFCGLARVIPNTVLSRYSCIPSGTISHEIGHEFRLDHTFERSNGVELVDGSNCATAGDLICDTPADPNRNDLVSGNDCIWEGTYEDENGFEIHLRDANGDKYTPSLSNLMSNYGVWGCRHDFTVQQSVIMHDFIEQNISFYDYETPKIAFEVYEKVDRCKEGYSIAARVIDPDPHVTYQWDFSADRKVDQSGIDVEHLYTEYGTYSIELSMTYPDGNVYYQSKQCIIHYSEASIVAPFLDGFSEDVEKEYLRLIEETAYKWRFNLPYARDQVHINENSIMEYRVDISQVGRGVLEFDYWSNTDAPVGGDSLSVELVSCDNEAILLFEKWGANLGTDGEYIHVSLPLPEVDSDVIRLRFTTKADAQNWHDLYIDNIQVLEDNVSNTEDILKEKLKIFPNPTTSKIAVLSDLNISHLRLMDMYGHAQKISFENDEIDLSCLSRGLYFIHAQLDGYWITRKIIKLD